MKFIKRIFTSALIVAFSATSIFAAPNCSNPTYRAAYPERCPEFRNTDNTFLAILGGAALVGAGVALAAQASGDSGKSASVSNQSSFPRLTLSASVITNYDKNDFVQNPKISYDYIPENNATYSIDDAAIQNFRSSDFYKKNQKQFDSINFAYSNARGFTGKNVSINILDNFYTFHGNVVNDLVNYIAKDANIEKYNIAASPEHLASYDYIANTINVSAQAEIYNASWQIPSNSTQNAAKVVYNQNSPRTYAAAQQYLYNLTSENFITQIRNTAIDNDAIFVWAAGNDSYTQSGALSALPLAFPELSGHFVNVIAVDKTNKIAWYSNQCGITQNYCIAAPGSAWNTDSLDFASGTSFATPVISGAIATIKEAFPYMNAQQITQLLFITAQDLGTPGIDEVYGWGLLDMNRATQPVGTQKIVLSNQTILPLSETNVSGIAGSAIKSANVQIAFVDDFGRAFTTNLSANVNLIPYGRGFDRLRESEFDSIDLFGGLEFGFKQDNLLQSSGLISAKSDSLTSFVGYKHEFDINNIKFYQNVRFGFSKPKPEENTLISEFSNIYTSSMKFGATWQDLSFEFAIPDMIMQGNMFLYIPVGQDVNGKIIHNNIALDLSSKPSMEYTVKYKYLSATFVENHDYQNEFFIMARGKFAF